MSDASRQLSLITPPHDVGHGLPPFLQRPDERGPLGRLTLVEEKEDSEGRGGPRWKLAGSPLVTELARKLFPG